VKRCTVVYALPERQYLWPVELDEGGTVRDALEAAERASAGQIPSIPWAQAEVGIFGEVVSREAVPHEGDRIEIYRPLVCDPKQARRERARLKRRTR
jgi:uncharacterized protein